MPLTDIQRKIEEFRSEIDLIKADMAKLNDMLDTDAEILREIAAEMASMRDEDEGVV